MRCYCQFGFLFVLLFSFASVIQAQTTIKSLYVDGNTLYAGTNYGVYVNEQDGFGWNKMNEGIPDVADISFFERHKKFIFGAAIGNGLFVLADRETTWKKIQLPITSSRFVSLFSNDTALFVIENSEGIIYSTDAGVHWKNIDLLKKLNPNTGENTDQEKNNKTNKKNNAKNDPTVLFEPKIKITDLVTYDGLLFAAVSSTIPTYGIYKSEDGGKNWIEASYDLQKVNINKIIPHNNKLYALTAGFNGEIYCSKDQGLHWEKLTRTPLRRISEFLPGKVALFSASQRDGVCVSYDYGTTWNKMDSLTLASDQTIENLAVTEKGLYVGTSDGIIFLTEDFGKWTVAEEALKTKKMGSFFYADIGTKKGVTLSASKYADEIIFKAENTTGEKVNVDIKLAFECGYSNEYGTGTFPIQKLEWRITVEPNSTKAYDTHPKECSVSSCKEMTVRWEIIDWKVE